MDTNLMQALRKPLAMDPRMISKMAAVIHRHSQGVKLSVDEIDAIVQRRDAEMSQRAGASAKPSANSDRPYHLSAAGVATISIAGVIAKRASQVNRMSGPSGTSVEAIRAKLNQAISDPDVQSIVLAIDSPGGSVDGIADICDEIYAARSKKQIVAFADGQMASAGYWIGSSASRIVASQDAAVGSIGVYAILEDWSKAIEEQGVKEEMIKAGKYKGYGHPDFAITDDARKLVQDEVDAYYSQFVNAVARNRGVTLQKALAMADGRIHIGSAALESGLVDEIGTLQSLQGFVSRKTAAAMRPSGREKESKMENEKVLLADATLSDVEKERPDLKDRIAADALRNEKARRAEISAAIKDSGLSESVQGNLAMSCEGMTVADARKEIDRTASIEAALASAKLAGGLNDEDLKCLRADVKDLPQMSAVRSIQSFVDAKKGSQARLVQDGDKVATGADQEKKPDAQSDALKAAVSAARADYAKVKGDFINLEEQSFVMQRLSGLKISATEDQVKALLK